MKRTLSLAVASMLTLAACGQTVATSADGTQRAPGVSPTAAAGAPQRVAVARVKSYKTLVDLRSDSAAVVVATATDNSEEAHLSDRFIVTRTEMRIEKTLWGKAQPQTITLQQNGGATFSVEPASKLVEPGKKYVLFIEPFVRNGPTPYTVIVGDQGAYELRSDSDLRLIVPQTTLPQDIALKDLLAKLTG
jgi:hypothetical protein